MTRSSSSSLLLLLAVAALAGCGGDPGAVTSDESAYTEDALVRFTADAWDPSWSGTPRAGGRLRVDYDFARLPQCRNQGRVVSWVVEVSYRFDGGPIRTAALPGSPGASEVLSDAGIAIPDGARSVELWFDNRAVGGYDHCEAWDSRYGQNYAHAIAD